MVDRLSKSKRASTHESTTISQLFTFKVAIMRGKESHFRQGSCGEPGL